VTIEVAWATVLPYTIWMTQLDTANGHDSVAHHR
jgi:hypothetical protein